MVQGWPSRRQVSWRPGSQTPSGSLFTDSQQTLTACPLLGRSLSRRLKALAIPGCALALTGLDPSSRPQGRLSP